MFSGNIIDIDFLILCFEIKIKCAMKIESIHTYVDERLILQCVTKMVILSHIFFMAYEF